MRFPIVMEGLRLPAGTVPLEYVLSLKVDMGESQYSGEVVIKVAVKNPTHSLRVHLDPLVEVDEAQIDGKTEMIVQRLPWQVLEVLSPDQLDGEHALYVRFHGNIGWGNTGFNSSQREGNIMAATHFEPIYARQVFPCFDEPQFKAVFRLTVQGDGFEVVSNTPVLRREGNLFEFHPTPLMSVYLLHWTICKLGKVTEETRGHQVSVYYLEPADAEAKCTLACRTLDYYEDFFGLSYVLPKLDLIPVHKLKVRAMENWGAITFHAHLLEQQGSLQPGEFVRNSRTLCHEISHMWFGNLVTMQWWDDLWLNEGFARFMEHKCLAALNPEYQLETLFLKDVMEVMLNHDQLPATHPVILPCFDPEEIDSIFDVISYGKGASLARMLEALMGEDTFREGIRRYMQKYQYGNATTENLWEILDQLSPVSHIMREWTHLSGHPNLLVELEGTTLKLQQTGSSDLWPLLLTFLTSTGKQDKVLMQTATLDLEVGTVDWVKLNLGHTVPIETLYPAQFLTSMNLACLSSQDIYGLVMDSFHFFKQGRVPFQALFSLLVRATEQCQHISLCRKAADIITFLDKELDGRNLFPIQLKALVLATMRPFTLVPRESFYGREARAISNTLILTYEPDVTAAESIFGVMREGTRPEEIHHLAQLVGQYAEGLPLPVTLAGEALGAAYQHAGPALIQAILGCGTTQILWSHARPATVLLQAAEAKIDSDTLEELVSRLVKNVDSLTELEAVQARLGSVSSQALAEATERNSARRALLQLVGLA